MGAKEDAFKLGLSELYELSSVKFEWLTNKPIVGENDESPLMQAFIELGGDRSGMLRKRTAKLSPDCFIPSLARIVEFDELQHFTLERQKTLRWYPKKLELGFSRRSYIDLCEVYGSSARTKGARGYRRPVSEFPIANGRHAQRAMFDMARDVLPSRYGFRPTIRITEFDLPNIEKDSPAETASLLETHLHHYT